MEQHGGMLSKSFVANTMTIIVIIITTTANTSTTTAIVIVVVIVAIILIIVTARIVSPHSLKHHTSIDNNIGRVNV